MKNQVTNQLGSRSQRNQQPSSSKHSLFSTQQVTLTNLSPKSQQPSKLSDLKEHISCNQQSTTLKHTMATVTQVPPPLNKKTTDNQLQPNKQQLQPNKQQANQQVSPISINKPTISNQHQLSSTNRLTISNNTQPSSKSKPVLTVTQHSSGVKQMVSPLNEIFFLKNKQYLKYFKFMLSI